MKTYVSHRQGLRSMLRVGMMPLGTSAFPAMSHLNTLQRMERGLIVVLPGIDGPSSVNQGIVDGLVKASIDQAIEVFDWRSSRPWSPLHLMRLQQNRLAAERLARRLEAYSQDYPHRPIHLIAHSAGAGIALFAAETLRDATISRVVLLAAAVHRGYSLVKALSNIERDLVNYWSPADFPVVGLGTMLFGSMDRTYGVPAGAMGFDRKMNATAITQGRLTQIAYSWRMSYDWNFGGHFGCTNARFIGHQVAPLLFRESREFASA